MAGRRGYASAFSAAKCRQQLAMRALAAYSNVPLAEIREGKASTKSGLISDAMCKLAALPIKVDDTGACTSTRS